MKQRLIAFIAANRLPVFVTSVVLLAVTLVAVSMHLYYSTAAFRLDLSRPEYLSLRSQINKDYKTSDLFEDQGAINEKTLQEFLTAYDKEAARASGAKAFANDVLGDEQLGIAGE